LAEPISIATARYGKWLAGDDADGPVDVAADHSFTALSDDFPSALRRWATPARLGAPQWGGGMLDAGARAYGGFVIRPVEDWVLLARTRMRPEAGEGKAGRTYYQIEAAALDEACWRKHGDSAILGLARIRPTPDPRQPDGRRIAAKPLRFAIHDEETWDDLAHVVAGKRWDVAAKRGFEAALAELREAVRRREEAPNGGWAFDGSHIRAYKADGPADLRFLAALALALRAERGQEGLPRIAATTGYSVPTDFATVAYVSDFDNVSDRRRMTVEPAEPAADPLIALNWDRAHAAETRDEAAAAKAATAIAREIAPTLSNFAEHLAMPSPSVAPPTLEQAMAQRRAVVAWLLGSHSNYRNADAVQMVQRLLRAIDVRDYRENLEAKIAAVLLGLPTAAQEP